MLQSISEFSARRWRRRTGLEQLESRTLLAADVSINEIHFDPDIKTELVEFVELHNSGDTDADLGGWSLANGITYRFDPRHRIAAGGYLVVAADPVAFSDKFGGTAAGPFRGKLSNEGERLSLVDADGQLRDEVTYQLGFPWPTVGDAPGNSIELIHPSFDNQLAGNWRSSKQGPTPGAQNSRFTVSSAPAIEQVRHRPQQPASGESVIVTARVADPDGVADVALQYQLVAPGDYIAIDDPRYAVQWTSLPMRDDGVDADVQPADATFSVRLPAELQQQRHLVRYRIRALDRQGTEVLVPYQDDPNPNFAYFVYDGIPDWRAAIQPGATPVETFTSDLLTSVQPYHLITTRQSHLDAQQIPGAAQPPYQGSDYPWHGAVVVGGEVYDHIRFRARGGVNRYARGKNAWKFDFNRGHQLEAENNLGETYSTNWDNLNLSHIANDSFRGEHGLVEALSYRLFNLASVEAPHTHFVHFRIIESAEEADPADQYRSDFQGLYLAVEQPDGRLLDEHGLPDGNFYKIGLDMDVPGSLNNQGPTQPADSSDLLDFVGAYSDRQNPPSEPWWRENFDLERYYSYRAMVEGVRHYDITGTNQFYFHDPQSGKWSVHPWDLDLTWRARDVFGNGVDAIARRIFRHEAIEREYHNRLRELLDLLFNHDQADMLIDEMTHFIASPGARSFVDADRAMWDYNPILAQATAGGVGQYYGAAETKDFGGMVQLMKNFIDIRTKFIFDRILRSEDQIPDTPTIEDVGDASHPTNGLRFSVSAYSTQTDQPFAAAQWRIAEVTDLASPGFDPNEPRIYEIDATWQSAPLPTLDDTFAFPGDQLTPGRNYRVRARMQDAAGHWSHWSDPIPFVTSAAQGPIFGGLRITELNYHPEDPDAASPFEDEDFEFVEFQNIGDQPLDLSGVTLSDAIRFTFADDESSRLAPDQRVLVVANPEAFASRYGPSEMIAGAYDGKLDNAGERIVARAADGQTIQNFRYDDGGSWPTAADGDGATLEIVDPLGDYNDPANWQASSQRGGSPGKEPRLTGDANGDGIFNSSDLVAVFRAGEYEDHIEDNSTFEDGDWNGDGDFDSGDLVRAFQRGNYVAAALNLPPSIASHFSWPATWRKSRGMIRTELRGSLPVASIDQLFVDWHETDLRRLDQHRSREQK